jgi:hypothetical protein
VSPCGSVAKEKKSVCVCGEIKRSMFICVGPWQNLKVSVYLCESVAKVNILSSEFTGLGGKLDINDLTYKVRGAIFEVNSILSY